MTHSRLSVRTGGNFPGRCVGSGGSALVRVPHLAIPLNTTKLGSGDSGVNNNQGTQLAHWCPLDQKLILPPSGIEWRGQPVAHRQCQEATTN